jgi:hypothetical protein
MRAYLLIFAMLVAPTVAYAACGSAGGPGFRGPDGKCVSWVNIGKVCGCPPTTRCTAEYAMPGAYKAAKFTCH